MTDVMFGLKVTGRANHRLLVQKNPQQNAAGSFLRFNHFRNGKVNSVQLVRDRAAQ